MEMHRTEKRLLVEGDVDKRVIPELIEAHGIVWERGLNEYVVEIESGGGIENLLAGEVIESELKRSDLRALGIVIDANDDAAGRWRRLRDACLPSVVDMPDALPRGGLVHLCGVGAASGITIGVWIMPDNHLAGMLETFLAFLVPAELEPLWAWTDALCDEAHGRGAPFKDQHREKARIHSWLAFQDPPGRQLHNAVMERILDPRSPHAAPFVSWFRTLYNL